MSASGSFVIPEVSPASDRDDVDSLASISSGDLSSEGDSDAQREWEASLEQLQLILTMVLIPFAGKYLGRKFAYWSKFWRQSLRGRRETRPTDNRDAGWARYMEWFHNVEIRWSSKKAFKVAGAVEAATSL